MLAGSEEWSMDGGRMWRQPCPARQKSSVIDGWHNETPGVVCRSQSGLRGETKWRPCLVPMPGQRLRHMPRRDRYQHGDRAGLCSRTKYDISQSSDWSRWPSRPIRSLRYIVTCTRWSHSHRAASCYSKTAPVKVICRGGGHGSRIKDGVVWRGRAPVRGLCELYRTRHLVCHTQHVLVLTSDCQSLSNLFIFSRGGSVLLRQNTAGGISCVRLSSLRMLVSLVFFFHVCVIRPITRQYFWVDVVSTSHWAHDVVATLNQRQWLTWATCMCGEWDSFCYQSKRGGPEVVDERCRLPRRSFGDLISRHRLLWPVGYTN